MNRPAGTPPDDVPASDGSAFLSLADAASRIVSTPDLDRKKAMAHQAAGLWFRRALSRTHTSRPDRDMPARPGRPEKPELRAPRDMPHRSAGGRRGRIALLHSLAHIELNAVDLTWDLVGRFAGEDLPRSFFDDWVKVGLEEAKHFGLLQRRLVDYESSYGALPAHDGLWEATQETAHSLLARLAILPLVLEARGLDVTPPLIDKMRLAEDHDSARVLEIIYRDEKTHVAFGAKWFRFMCDRCKARAEPAFHELVRKHFRGPLKPPFNDRARSQAGLTPGFYRPLMLTGP
ncbi:MAG: ferritin-like domain-containing protein [Pseudomonadota bacterium]